MFEVLRSGVRKRVVAVGVVAALITAGCVVVLASGLHNRHPAPQPNATTPTSGRASIPLVITPPTAPTRPSPTATPAPFVRAMPETSSPDVYAAAVAEALWNVDYAATSRDAVLAFWRAQLARTLPAGTPAGTTLAQAQDAAMSTITDYLPSDATWSTLASDHTVSSFAPTAVSEPPSWVAAIAAGDIADPGLTARTVIGVQKLTYEFGGAMRTLPQTQQLTVALLCPPTTVACRVEVIPPRDEADTSG
jgi:hypothetical protein